jgi:hypothetical protein
VRSTLWLDDVIVRTDLRRGNEVISQCKHDEANEGQQGAQYEISIDGFRAPIATARTSRFNPRGS